MPRIYINVDEKTKKILTTKAESEGLTEKEFVLRLIQSNLYGFESLETNEDPPNISASSDPEPIETSIETEQQEPLYEGEVYYEEEPYVGKVISSTEEVREKYFKEVYGTTSNVNENYHEINGDVSFLGKDNEGKSICMCIDFLSGHITSITPLPDFSTEESKNISLHWHEWGNHPNHFASFFLKKANITLEDTVREIEYLHEIAHSSTYRDVAKIFTNDSFVQIRENNYIHPFSCSRLSAMTQCARIVEQQFPQCLDLPFFQENKDFDLIACEFFPLSYFFLEHRFFGLYEKTLPQAYEFSSFREEWNVEKESKTLEKTLDRIEDLFSRTFKKILDDFDATSSEGHVRRSVGQFISLSPVAKNKSSQYFAKNDSLGIIISKSEDFLNMVYNVADPFPLKKDHYIGLCDCCNYMSILPGETFKIGSFRSSNIVYVDKPFKNREWRLRYDFDEDSYQPTMLCHIDCLNRYFLSPDFLRKQIEAGYETWRADPNLRSKELYNLKRAVTEKFGRNAPFLDWETLSKLNPED